MPQRLEPFLNKHIYHVFNRTIDSRNIFRSTEYSSLFLELLKYYQLKIVKMSYSKFRRLPENIQNSILSETPDDKECRSDILAYCLMPTHFHLLLRQVIDDGIARFVSDVVNSFTRKYNLENKRKGPLFLPKFKSVGLVTDEQLIHVSRYIHLNPYSSGLVNNISDIENYKWSSFSEYINWSKLCRTDQILDLFQDRRDKYKQFVLDNADYQRNLELVKYSDKW